MSGSTESFRGLEKVSDRLYSFPQNTLTNYEPDYWNTHVNEFLEIVEKSGKLPLKIAAEWKSGEPKDVDQIRLFGRADYRIRRGTDHPYDLFYFDAPLKFVLAKKGSVNEAVCLAAKPEFDKGDLERDFYGQKNILLSNQLQGPSYNKIGRPVFPEFRWPFVLLNVVNLYAYHAGFRRVAVLPYDQNGWEPVRSNPAYKLRFDVSARECGFDWNERYQFYEKVPSHK